MSEALSSTTSPSSYGGENLAPTSITETDIGTSNNAEVDLSTNDSWSTIETAQPTYQESNTEFDDAAAEIDPLGAELATIETDTGLDTESDTHSEAKVALLSKIGQISISHDELNKADQQNLARIEEISPGLGKLAVAEGTLADEEIDRLEIQFDEEDETAALNQELEKLAETQGQDQAENDPEDQLEQLEEQQQAPEQEIDYEELNKKLKEIMGQLIDELVGVYQAINQQFEEGQRIAQGKTTYTKSPGLIKYSSDHQSEIVNNMSNSGSFEDSLQQIDGSIAEEIQQRILADLIKNS